MKGVSRFVTYSFTVLLGFIVLIVFSSLIYGYYDQVLKSNIKAGLKQITIQTLFGIIKLHDLGLDAHAYPKNSSSIVISSISLNYPDKVSGKDFEIELISSPGVWNLITNMTIDGKDVIVKKVTSSGSKIIAKTTQSPFVIYEYEVPNIPVILQGKFVSRENDSLSLVRYNYNGFIEDRIILGEENIIIGVMNVS
jgi:hypothetical protein